MKLAPKLYYLRLDLEQVQHIFDGLIENRKLIDQQYLFLYDSSLQDLQDQMASQGVEIQLGEPSKEVSIEDDEIEQVRHLLVDMQTYFNGMNVESHERETFDEKLSQLQKLLFGDDELA